MLKFIRFIIFVALGLFFLLRNRIDLFPSSNNDENGDSSYPQVCIPHSPPDLDCGDIRHRNFRVVGQDPHRFDGDKDGIGCERR